MIDDCCDSVVWRMMGKHQVKLDSAHDTWPPEVLSLWEEMRFFMIIRHDGESVTPSSTIFLVKSKMFCAA